MADPAPAFNVDAARSAGYSDDEILQHLTQNRPNFDLQGALKAGYSPPEIISHLAAMPSTPAVAAPDTPIAGLKEYGRGINPLEQAKAPIFHQFTQPGPPSSVVNELLPGADSYIAQVHQGIQEARDAYAKGDYATAARKALSSVIPLIGQPLNRAADLAASGQPYKAAGATGAIATNLFGPQALEAIGAKLPVGEAMQGAAEKIYQSALKPSKSFSPAKRAQMVKSGLAEGTSVGATGQAASASLIPNLEQAVGDAITNPSQPISPSRTIQYLQDTEKKFSNQATPTTDVAAIRAARDDFLDAQRPGGPIRQPDGTLRDMTAAEAQQIKVATSTQLRKNYGRLGSADVEAQKSIVRALKDDLVANFPEIAPANARLGGQLALAPALDAAVTKAANRHFVGIGVPIASLAVQTITHNPKLTVAAGVMKAVLDDPVVRSKIAIAINKAGSSPMSLARARIAGYANALGQASDESSKPASDQPNE